MTDRKRAVKLPAIPGSVFSIMGDTPVTLVNGLLEKDKAHGAWSAQKRDILIDQDNGVSLENQWMSLWHEITHMILSDSGATTNLKDRQEELICDAIGGYLTAMMKAGRLKVK